MDLSESQARSLAERLFKDNGFTYPTPPSRGWMVGGTGTCIKRPYSEYCRDGADNELMFQRLVRDILRVASSIERGGYIGGWFEPNEGINDCIIYLEESDRFITKDRAIAVAKRRKEVAIYSLAEKRSVKLDELTGGK